MGTQQIIFALLYFAFGAGLIYLSVLVVRDSARIRVNRVTAAMLFLAGLGPIFSALGSVISPYRAASPFRESYLYNLFYLWEFFFPVFLYFSWIFPVDRLAAKRSRWRYLIFIPHLFHIILVIFFADTDRILRMLTINTGEGGFLSTILEPIASLLKWLMIPIGLLLASHKKLFALVNLVYVIVALTYLFRGMKRVDAPRLRRQVQILIWGILASLGLYIIAFTLPNLLAIEISETVTSLLTVLSLVVGAGSIGWAIVRYQFLDIRLIVRQSLVYTISSALLVGGYILAITELSDVLKTFLGQETPLVNIGFIIVALILFQPINNQIDTIITKMFLRDRSDYRTIIDRLSLQIINILDRTQLFKAVEDTLKGSMLVAGVGFGIYDDARRAYLFFPWSDGPETRLDNTDPLLGAIGQLTAPTFYDRIEAWRRGSPLATILQGRNILLIVPLRDREHLLGFLALRDKTSGFKFRYEDITLLSTLANQMVIAMTNVRLYRESLVKQRLEEEMNLARRIQMDLLPKTPPRGAGFTIATHSRPSRTVGGDFYDFVPAGGDGEFGLVIADVSGKGMPAALLAAQIQAALRSEVINRRDVAQIMTNVNNLVAGLSSSSGKFATVFYGAFHPGTREFVFSNAGHNYPLLVRADGRHELLETGGTIIGAFEGNRYQAARVVLEPNDLLFFYTDGLSEAHNALDEEFGEERIIDYVIDNRWRSADAIRDGIIDRVNGFVNADTSEDDTTVVVLKMNG